MLTTITWAEVLRIVVAAAAVSVAVGMPLFLMFIRQARIESEWRGRVETTLNSHVKNLKDHVTEGRSDAGENRAEHRDMLVAIGDVSGAVGVHGSKLDNHGRRLATLEGV